MLKLFRHRRWEGLHDLKGAMYSCPIALHALQEGIPSCWHTYLLLLLALRLSLLLLLPLRRSLLLLLLRPMLSAFTQRNRGVK